MVEKLRKRCQIVPDMLPECPPPASPRARLILIAQEDGLVEDFLNPEGPLIVKAGAMRCTTAVTMTSCVAVVPASSFSPPRF